MLGGKMMGKEEGMAAGPAPPFPMILPFHHFAMEPFCLPRKGLLLGTGVLTMSR